MEKLQLLKEKINNSPEGTLQITYYTDPLCAWSWAFQPEWEQLLLALDARVNVRYCMSGLLASWDRYTDPVLSVSRPAQMGPVWMDISRQTGTDIRTGIWHEDPPASSYPACVAVKCAALQSAGAESTFLLLTRKAVMLEGRNIARKEVLHDIAAATASVYQAFDVELFTQQLGNSTCREAFNRDLEETRNHQVQRFPTLEISSPTKGRKLRLTGYRPAEALFSSISSLLT